MPPPSAPARRVLKAQAELKQTDEGEDTFDELLEKLRDKKHEDDEYDESQVSVCM